MKNKITIAVPKGRILDELLPVFKAIGIIPEASFFDKKERKLQFDTNCEGISLVRVRSFDIATLVAFGAAEIGVCGSDVLMEFDYAENYAPIDLGIGKCRLSIAEPREIAKSDDVSKWSHIRIATKYPNITQAHFAKSGVQVECIKLNGAMELAPKMGLCRRIVDLVSSGATLRENGLVEVEKIADISSYLIINRTAFKTKHSEIQDIMDRFNKVVG